jgi:hypothetical protein
MESYFTASPRGRACHIRTKPLSRFTQSILNASSSKRALTEISHGRSGSGAGVSVFLAIAQGAWVFLRPLPRVRSHLVVP